MYMSYFDYTEPEKLLLKKNLLIALNCADLIINEPLVKRTRIIKNFLHQLKTQAKDREHYELVQVVKEILETRLYKKIYGM